MNYTHDKNQIVFLKDADIVSAFNEKNALDEVVLSNGIPSYELFKKTYDVLSTYDNNLSSYVKDHVNVSVDNLSALLNKTILSVNGISNYVDTLELSVNGLSTYIDILELSVNGLSIEVDRISAELSNELNRCELSVNGLSALVNGYKDGLSTSIDNLSAEQYQRSEYLSGQVQDIWKDIKGGVNYKGHLKGFEEYKNLPLCMIFGYHYNLVDTQGVHKLSASIPLNNGWLYNVTLTGGPYDVTDARPFTLENNDYLIIHSKDVTLSCVEISDLTRDNIDIIESILDDYVRLAKLQEVSAWLENDYSTRDLKLSTALSNEIKSLTLSVDGLSNYTAILTLSVNGLSVEVDRISSELSTELNKCELSVKGLSVEVDRISSELSTELNKCELSVNGLSTYIDILELSVNGLSIEVDRISAELSNELKSCELSVNGLSVRTSLICAEISNMLLLSVDSLQNQIISNDSDISSISSDLSILTYHYNKSFDEKYYTCGTTTKDMSVDVLNVVDSENTDNQYTLLFLSGTLVLVKKSI